MPDDPTLARLRQFLLVLFLGGAAGTGAELLLIDHTEDRWQWVPLVLLGAGVLAAAGLFLRATPLGLRAFRALMLLFVASGLAGLWLHYQGNVEFALELAPDLAGWALFTKAVAGKSPPSLAPAAMAGLGLLGLAWSYHHPALDSITSTTSPKEPPT